MKTLRYLVREYVHVSCVYARLIILSIVLGSAIVLAVIVAVILAASWLGGAASASASAGSIWTLPLAAFKESSSAHLEVVVVTSRIGCWVRKDGAGSVAGGEGVDVSVRRGNGEGWEGVGPGDCLGDDLWSLAVVFAARAFWKGEG
jgi:hypothetical protein